MREPTHFFPGDFPSFFAETKWWLLSSSSLFPTYRFLQFLWSCLPDFFSPFPQQLKLQTGDARVFFFSLLLLLLLLHRSCLSFSSSTVCCLLKPHRRTRDHQPGPTVSAGPQMCTKTSGRQRSAWRFVVALVRFFPRKRERERKGVRGREREKCGTPAAPSPAWLLPSDCSLLYSLPLFFRFLHPLFCFVSPSSSWFKLFPPSNPC